MSRLATDFGNGNAAPANTMGINKGGNVALGAPQPNTVAPGFTFSTSLPTNSRFAWAVGTSAAGVSAASIAQHDTAGNLALSDGSVQQVTSSGLEKQMQQGMAGLGAGTSVIFPN